MSLVALSPGTVTLTLLDADQTQQMVLEVGVPGAAGSAGAAATIAAGTTTTLSPGSSATVTNAGTSSAAVFNFGIPAGQTGATGATGAAGAGVAVGGTTGQLLSKQSGASYDTVWTTVIPGDRYLTTSTTSNTISNGNKTFTIGTGLSYTPTQNITISYDASNHMHGEVLTYNSGTGVLTVDINHHTGSSTYTSWVVNVGGVTPATSVAWGAITGTLSTQTDLQTALDLKAALESPTFTTRIYTPAIRNILNTDLVVDAYNDTGAGTHFLHNFNANDGRLVLATNGGGLTFPDATTQTTAGLTDAPSDGSQYARQSGAWAVVTGGGGGVAWGGITGTLSSQTDLQGELDLKANLVAPVFTSGIEVDGGLTVPGPSGNATFTYSGLNLSPSSGGITFADATVQSTAAVAPPSADVMTANAIASNIYSMGYGSSTWVGSGNPSVSGLIGWGIYNATDGLIAYSYSTGNTFYLASSPTTLANSSVQVNGSNSSFYVA